VTEGSVTGVGTDRWDAVADVLAAAFVDDPVFSWLLPDAGTRRAALRRLFAIEGRHRALPLGRSVAAGNGADGTGGLAGAVLALPPGNGTPSAWFQVRHGPGYARVFGRHLLRAGRLSDAMTRVHPSTPHLYLFAIGVRPELQGRGVATAMLEPLLRRCDAEQLPAYLEASSPRNARLYRRLGFVTDDVLRVGDSPPLELMTRPPC
jgi:GNAT superfamily N-acetyltransferase